jgi:TRAP-type C4-dicarboxylate transport system permease small subunit
MIGRETAHRLDRALAWATEIPAAALVALEIVVLSAGVISRYVFRNPLTWSDELASILFLWLAMLGAVIALRRGEHMRLTAIVNRLPPRRRDLVETVAAMVVLIFVLLVILPASEYVSEEWAILTPGLEIQRRRRSASPSARARPNSARHS